MQIRMNPLKGVRIHECVGRSSPLGRGRREATVEGCRFGQVSSNLATLTLPSPRGRGFMTVYPMARVSTLGMLGKFAAALVAVVVIQGVFSFKFKVFGFKREDALDDDYGHERSGEFAQHAKRADSRHRINRHKSSPSGGG